MKYSLLLFFFFFIVADLQAQTNSFDVLTFQSPEYFIKSELPSSVQWSMKNNDTSFYVIIVYKSLSAKDDIVKDVTAQWNEQVVKRLTKGGKKTLKIMTEQLWDGWASTLAIGNFYQSKKKCVVMLYSFRKDKVAACAVYALSDKLFKEPIKIFQKTYI